MIFGSIFIGTFLFAKLSCLSSDKVRFAHNLSRASRSCDWNDGKMEYWARSEALALCWVFCIALKNIMIHKINPSLIK
jgi:hypothetical protein